MNIKSITIKNVRGIEDSTYTLNMMPDKPSIIVAPNGTGKSSFAYAFQWLGKLKMKQNEDDAFNNEVNNKPVLVIETDEDGENTYTADNTKNEISKKFGVYVINNGLKASTPGIARGIPMGKSHITVEEIEVLGVTPEDNDLTDDFDNLYHTEGVPVGVFPSLNPYISNKAFMATIRTEHLKMGKVVFRRIDDFINRFKGYTGTKGERFSKAEADDYETLMRCDPVSYAFNKFKRQNPDEGNGKLLIKAIKLVALNFHHIDSMCGRVAYLTHKKREDDVKSLFETINETWRDIKPHVDHGRTILKIGDAQRISNGERDILILLGMLQNAKSKFTSEYNILIIDEVFDYLDDANLVVAQHYINKLRAELKDEEKHLFPILLSHINPSYYRTFAFKDMKVYYLKPLKYPNASDNMMKLLRRRSLLEKTDKPKADLISRYMLHFYKDYTIDMTEAVNMYDPNWNDINVFKAYCVRQLEKYIANEAYDALAVCVALREIIETYCYQQISEEDQKLFFLHNCYGTEKKLDYAYEIGVEYPETFSLLGLIYNDPLHPDNKSNTDLRQTLYSRLENETIRSMVQKVKELS